MGEQKSLKKGVALYATATTWSVGVATLTSLIMRGVLSADVFGIFNYVSTLVTYVTCVHQPVGYFIDAKVPMRLKDETKEKVLNSVHTAYRVVYLLAIIESILLLLFLWPKLNGPLFQVGAFVLVGTLMALEIQKLDRLLLKAHLKFWELFVVTLVTSLFSAASMIGLGIWVGGKGYFIGYGIGLIVTAIITRVVVRRTIMASTKRNFNAKESKTIFKEGSSIAAFRFGEQVFGTIDRFLVEWFMGLGSLGIYSLAISLEMLVLNLPKSITGGILPIYLRKFTQSAEEKRKTYTKLYTKISLDVGLLVCLMAMISADLLIPWLLPQYLEAIVPGKILFICGLVRQSRSVAMAYIYAVDRTSWLLYSTIPGFALNVGLSLLFIPKFGLTGAALANCMTFLISFVIQTWIIEKNTRNMLWLRTALSVSLAGTCILLGNLEDSTWYVYGVLLLSVVLSLRIFKSKII